MSKNIVSQAVQDAGGPSALARSVSAAVGLPVSHSTVIKWRNNERIPARYVIAVERITGISRHQLRADVFGPAPTAPREAA